jgi:quercetin dioxygenase-like cupin family protein
MQPKEIERLIVKPLRIEDLIYHDISRMEMEVGPLYRFMDKEMVSESDVTVLVRDVRKEVSKEAAVGPSLHRHDSNQIYCLLGDLTVEVIMGSEKKLVPGPASILIPAGTEHAIRFSGGKGFLVNILSRPQYK